MAKRNNESTLSVDKAKVRVFFAEVEGNNESVQEALKTMVSAMSRPVRIISEQKFNGGATLLAQQADAEDIEEAFDQSDDEGLSDEAPQTTARLPRGAGKKSDRNAGLALVPNLDFRPSGEKSLKEFLNDKGAGNDVEVTLTSVYFMQHSMSLPKIGPSHVMTAFKEAGIAVPVDLRQTIRNIKKKRMWLNFTDLEDIKMTTQGDNYVEHEMGKGK